MADQPSNLTTLWNELRRRHVVRVAVGYAAVAFVVLQMGEIVLPAFTEDPIWLRLLVVLAALLFPLVVVLAWVYEITPRGIRRMAEIDAEAGVEAAIGSAAPRLALLVMTLATVGFASWWAIQDTLTRSRLAQEGVEQPELIPARAAYDPTLPMLSLAVLPLDEIARGETDDFFATSMHQTLISSLMRLPALRVAPRSAVMPYGESELPLRYIGQELDVAAVLTGTVIESGDDVRVTVNLVQAASEEVVWTETYDGKLDDVLALQSQIATEVATTLQGELLPEEQTLMAANDVSDDPEANRAFMRGSALIDSGDEAGMREAEQFFEEAAQKDPEFGLAFAEQARVKLELGMMEGDSTLLMMVLPEVQALADRAIQLDPESADVQALYQFVHRMGDGPGEDAIPAPPQVEPASPATATARAGAGETGITIVTSIPDSTREMMIAASELGRRLEARWAEWAVRSSPSALEQGSRAVHAAEMMHGNGKTEVALELLQSIRVKAPDFQPAWDATERIYADEERYDDIVILRRDRVVAAGGVMTMSDVEDLEENLEDEGAYGYWEWRSEELEDRMDDGEKVSYVDMAIAHIHMGDHDGAIDYLEEAARMRDRRLLGEVANPAWDPIRQDERFRNLVSRIRRVTGFRPAPGDRPRGPRGR